MCSLLLYLLNFNIFKIDGIKVELITDIIDRLCVYTLSLLFDKYFLSEIKFLFIYILIHVC